MYEFTSYRGSGVLWGALNKPSKERSIACLTKCDAEMWPYGWINEEARLLKHRAAQPARQPWKHQSVVMDM